MILQDYGIQCTLNNSQINYGICWTLQILQLIAIYMQILAILTQEDLNDVKGVPSGSPAIITVITIVKTLTCITLQVKKICLTYTTAQVQTNHGQLPLNKVDGVICGMLQSLVQSTCTRNGRGAITWHCGQLPDAHNHLYLDGFQTVSSGGTPTLCTEIQINNTPAVAHKRPAKHQPMLR